MGMQAVGFFLNVVAGLFVFLLCKFAFDWLPSEAELHERIRDIQTLPEARDRITALNLMIFVAFFWLFLANMLWVLLEVLIEVLNWPEMLGWLAAKYPPIANEIEAMKPGLVVGRSFFFVFVGCVVAVFFFRGSRIARQCWDVYKTVGVPPRTASDTPAGT